jgi:hypothetical protein
MQLTKALTDDEKLALAIARTAIALILHLRFGNQFDIDHAYAEADRFMQELAKDLVRADL